VTTSSPESAKSIAGRDRNRLIQLVRQSSESGRRRLLTAIVIVLLPLAAAMVADLAGRAFGTHPYVLLMPWTEPEGPWPALRDHFDPNGWGDLLHLSRLPYHRELVHPGPDRARRLTTDEAGFPNSPSGTATPIEGDYDVILTGASFMALATDVERNIAGQLADRTGLRTYNAAWWGAGPVRGVLYVISRPEFGSRAGQTLVWGIIQRDLYAREFSEISERVTETGEIVSPPASRRYVALLKRLRSWNQQLEQYLEATSWPRSLSERAGFALPTVALDRGVGSMVLAARRTDEQRSPMLFFQPAIDSAYRDYASRGGDEIVEAIGRVDRRCRSRGVRLLVMLIPDKYELFRDHIETQLPPSTGTTGGMPPAYPDRRATAAIAEKLRERGIEAIDLYPSFQRAQFESPTAALLYRADDTHWSDRGVRTASEVLARYLASGSGSATAE
jgi:hypothetical protein